MAKKKTEEIITNIGTMGVAANAVYSEFNKSESKLVQPVCPKCKGILFLLGKRGQETDLRCNKCDKDYTMVI